MTAEPVITAKDDVSSKRVTTIRLEVRRMARRRIQP